VAGSLVNEIVDEAVAILRGRLVLVRSVGLVNGCGKEINRHDRGLWEAGSANEVVVEGSGCPSELGCLLGGCRSLFLPGAHRVWSRVLFLGLGLDARCSRNRGSYV
jgi:hypothetical protein